jgi:tetratricopeptide (TPR) repeat protein
VSTNKLTRKEIISEDPVHHAMIRSIELFRMNGAKIGIMAVVVLALAFGVYGVSQYLGKRETQAQDRLGRGIEFFNAMVVADATDDPFGKGLVPTFRNDQAKYQAAAKEFSSIASGFGFGEIRLASRYYLGLCQLQLGQQNEAIKSLEAVIGNSKNRTIGFLAKRVIAFSYFNSKNYKGSQELLAGMIRDPKCDLPKEDLSIQLSRVLDAQGKRDEAIKVLREADVISPAFGAFKQQLVAELDRLQKAQKVGAAPKPVLP